MKAEVAQAQQAFTNKPKALWTTTSYLSPKLAADLSALLAELNVAKERDASARERIAHWVQRLEAAEARVREIEKGLRRIGKITDPLVHTGPSATKVSEVRVVLRALLPEDPHHD